MEVPDGFCTQSVTNYRYISMALSKTLKPGDKVSWNSSQGTIKGTIKKKLTAPMKIKSHQVAASPENPEYLVVSTKTGAKAAHKPGELKKSGK